MKKYAPLLLLIIPIYFAIAVSCIPSLHPIYTDDDVIFEPGLLGTWYDINDVDHIWNFTQSGDGNAYIVSAENSEDGGTLAGDFLGHLVEIDDYIFLDLYPMPEEEDGEDLRYELLIPAHAFFLVEQMEPSLLMINLDQEGWLEPYLYDNPEALDHTYVGEDMWGYNDLLLTAKTEDLQAFFVEHAETEGAYGDPTEFHRIEDPEENPEEEIASDEDD